MNYGNIEFYFFQGRTKTIKFRVFALVSLMILLVLFSTGSVLNSLNKAKDDADILNALGRQRMLTQAMGKSALGYAMSKSGFKTIENQISSLNQYITQMRAVYASTVVPVAKKTGLKISMDPRSEKHPAVPFPATLTRMVNERFAALGNLSIDIIAEEPANPDKGYKSEMDVRAGEFLKLNNEEIFSETLEDNEKLSLIFYTADLASVQGCAACHTKLMGTVFHVGDMLGIRKFRLVFSDNIAIGKAELNPSLEEYKTAKTIFAKTLTSMKSGGEYPLDLKMKKVKYFNGIDDQTSQDKIAEIENKFGLYLETVDTLLNSKVGSNIYRQARSDILTQSNQLRKVSNDLVTIYTNLANRNQSSIRMAVILSGIAILLIVAVMAFYANSVVIKPIKDTTEALRDIAEGEGDLTRRLDGNRSDEIGDLARSFNTFIAKIHDIVLRVKEATMNVNASSSEISASVQEQSSITSQQSSSVSEITSTMEELTATSNQIADNSESVVQISNGALESTENGVAAVEEIQNKMQEISKDNQNNIDQIVELGKKSKEITKVMEIINNVADQTKLIAFNAAIEASSAGEAGKRFGVVAVEIRRLADNVMESTEDIQTRIEEIQDAVNRLVIASEKSSKRVEEGNELSSQTVEVLLNILNGAKTTVESAKQISLSTQQQKTASNQVVSSLKEIAEGAKQSSASIKQTSETTDNLTALSNDLKGLVERFKLDGEKGDK